MRNVLSIAITEMTYRAGNVTVNNTDKTCPSESESLLRERPGYKWSEQLQGIILGRYNRIR